MPTRRYVALDRFGPPDVMRWTTGPAPQRGEGEVLVAVEAIGLNFADTMVRRGEYRRDQSLDFTPGFEVAGHVLESGDGGPAPGTPVLVFCENGGGYADTISAPADHVFTLIEGMAPRDAAALFTQGVTAWYAVHRYGQVGEGDWVLVHAAAGGLGGMSVQLAALAGARVVATASTPAKLEIARRYGATETVLADPETLTAGVRAATGGHGADVVIDGVGGDLFMPSMRALAFGGRYLVVGSASQAPAMLDVRALMPRGQTVTGVLVARVAEQDPSEPQRAFDEIQRLVLSGELRPDVRTMPAAEIAAAHELIESRSLTGKVVLELEPA
ncbi:quinone oxidoreductase family protein [Baekduia soli]|uniref:quinone oxidoreductase family protein n=1 Tax=Baekduia soli TaxID=496014 RepID=UPI0016528984|nr:NADPH:quinone oxidoreductase family protein [Baekduia soli]